MTASWPNPGEAVPPIGAAGSRARRGVHGSVVEYIGQRVVSGAVAPGTVIVPDSLAVELQVSRTVVREAVKVLTAKGLVDARQRTGTCVLPRSRWSLLDADVIRWRNMHGPDPRLLVELEEVRQAIEPWGAWAGAQRRTPEHVEALRQAFEAMNKDVDRADSVTEADIQFHRAVVASAGNELLDRIEALLEPFLRVRNEFSLRHDHGTAFLDDHRRVADCIEYQRAEDARDAMISLLRAAALDTEWDLARETTAAGVRRPSPRRRRKAAGA